MTKPVTSEIPAAISFPLPPAPNPSIDETMERILDTPPVSPPPIVDRVTLNGHTIYSNESEITIKATEKGLVQLKFMPKEALPQNEDEAPCFIALDHLNSSPLTAMEILVKAMLLIKTYKNKENLIEVVDVLEQLHEKLLESNNVEKNNPFFMHLFGTVYLYTGRHGVSSEHLNKAKICYLKALKLTPQDDPALKNKILMGLNLSFLYQVRSEIIENSTKKKVRLHELLKSSRSYLAEASKLNPHPGLNYLTALNHALTVLLLREEKLAETKEAKIESLFLESENHLKEALTILGSEANKTYEMLALYGGLKYIDAFDQHDVDYAGACEALQQLSAAFALNEEDSTLLMTMADCTRQLAWVLPKDIFRAQAEKYIKKAIQASNVVKILSVSSLLVFNIQKALWQISETSQKLLESPNKDLEEQYNAAQKNLKNSISRFKLLLEKTEEAQFKSLKANIKFSTKDIEADLASAHLASHSQEELRAFNTSAQKVGDNLDALFQQALFKYLLLERLQSLEFVIEE